MTRCNQKAAEHEVVERLLSALNVRAGIDHKREKPDIALKMSERTIGVEVTTYASDKNSVSADRKHPTRRAIEAAWECFESASASFRMEHRDLKDIGVIFWFKRELPHKNSRQQFLLEIKEFVLSKKGELGHEFSVYSGHEFTSPLMAKYVRDIAANIHADVSWDSDKTSGFIERPGPTISEIVAKKSALARSYSKMDEMWLLIDGSGRPSEMILPIHGASEFESDKELHYALEGSPFSKVYAFTSMGLFEWTRLGGWRNVRPERR